MMKSYKKMADEVLEAVNKHDAKKLNRRIKLRIAVPSACCCLATVFALVVWQSGVLDKNGLSSGPENNSQFAEGTTTEEQSETPAKTMEAACTEAEKNPETTQSEYGFELAIDTEPENIEATDEPETSENGDITVIHVPNIAVTDDEVPIPYTEDITDWEVQTEDVRVPETQTQTIPIDDGIDSYFRFEDNVHAPLDDYEFTLPLTPKNTDIILALLNAYEIPDPDDSIKNTQYALDIGVYLEAGYSNIRTYIQAAKGDAVYALQDGKVAGTGWSTSLGRTVWVENSEGTYIGYFHLNEIAVNEGDTVSKDQLIGYAGTTGRIASASAAYMRRNTITDIIKLDWHREDNIIKFNDDDEEPPKEYILPVEPPLIHEIQ
ncbi:MAG: M23 family metallopeptidase [Ruminococcaceae bacterium]|nr:M23 family metallopeptidase [Oscillospiraceae bacterium]